LNGTFGSEHSDETDQPIPQKHCALDISAIALQLFSKKIFPSPLGLIIFCSEFYKNIG